MDFRSIDVAYLYDSLIEAPVAQFSVLAIWVHFEE